MGINLRGMGEFATKYREAVHTFGKNAIYRQVLILLLKTNSITY